MVEQCLFQKLSKLSVQFACTAPFGCLRPVLLAQTRPFSPQLGSMSWKGGWKRQLGLGVGSRDSSSLPAAADRGDRERSRSPRRCEGGEAEFRKTLGVFFLANKLSAKDTFIVASSAIAAGAMGSDDLGDIGCAGKFPGNMHRDLMRRLLNKCSWPREYYCRVPVRGSSGEKEFVDVPVLLPHEVLQVMVAQNPEAVGALQASAEQGAYLLPAVEHFAKEFEIAREKVIPIGFHGDGVPFSAKMGDSLEQFSWNFPALQGGGRILFAAVPQSCLWESATFDELLSVWSWSMAQFVNGRYPSVRRNGSDFGEKGREREALAGQQLSHAGCLVQLRGDWAFYKSTFRFPSWASRTICWKCSAAKGDTCMSYKNCGEGAPWRDGRLSGNQFLKVQRRQGIKPSPIFASPGCKVDYVMVDWLHAVDLGVGADMLGNVFNEVVDLLPGLTRKERVQNMWGRLRAWYKEARPPSQLQTLTPEMVRLPGKPPKLRAKAGECRYLLPFGAALAAEFAEGSEHRKTVGHLTRNLLEVATCVSKGAWDDQAAKKAARKFCLLYTALEKEALASGDPTS